GRACSALAPITGGTPRVVGRRVTRPRPRGMLDAGLVYLPPDRRAEGLVMERCVRENIALASLPMAEFSGRLLLKRRSERAICGALAERLRLAPPRIERAVAFFSGGNQQRGRL